MSKLNDYIGKLMHDDDALKAFLNDPVKAGEKENGITKAERAVLRRTVFHLSNNSKNGYSLQRDLSSYRRSIRLLQNVMHGVAAQHTNMAFAASATGDTGPTIKIYYTGDTDHPGAPVDNPALAYKEHIDCMGSSGSTLGEVMNFQGKSDPKVGDNVHGSLDGVSQTGKAISVGYTATYNLSPQDGNIYPYITAFTIPTSAKDGSPSGCHNPGTYSIALPTPLAPGKKSPKVPDLPFWFYSINGQAIDDQQMKGVYKKTDAEEGNDGQSFESYPLDNPNIIVWQAIAPDQKYGFAPCLSNDQA